MSIAFAFFFFSSETLQKRFLPKKEVYTAAEIKVPKYRSILLSGFAIYFILQLALPVRHWFYKDDVLWTEEGHRLSWRMMLRTKRGMLTVWIEDKLTGQRQRYDYTSLLTPKQSRTVPVKPDLMWQLAQRIKKKEASKGSDVAVFMDIKVRINNGEYFRLINFNTDLAAEKWHHFKHHDWILPQPEDYVKKEENK
jgi:hypothetical protein